MFDTSFFLHVDTKNDVNDEVNFDESNKRLGILQQINEYEKDKSNNTLEISISFIWFIWNVLYGLSKKYFSNDVNSVKPGEKNSYLVQ